MARAPQSLSKIAAPAGACAALGLAVGVWLIPNRALDPHAPAPAVALPMPQVKPPAAPTPAAAEPHDWTALAQNLSKLREPIPETEVVQGSTGGGEQPPPPPPPSQISWQYEGYVMQGDQVVALVRTSSGQRFVFVDQEVQDPSLPSGHATIKSITPEELVVMINGAEVRVPRTQQTQNNELIRAQPATAGRTE